MSKPPKLPGRDRRTPAKAPAAMFADLAKDGRLRRVSLEAIVPNPRQPRKRFDQDALQALAHSITVRGILQPPVVREAAENGHYELVAGERRWRAARLAGLSELDVLVQDLDDGGMLEAAMLENIARADFSPVEKARGFASMIEDLGLTREAVGKRVGESRVSVSNHLRLLDLPDDVLDLLDDGTLSFAHGRALLLCDDHATRRALARRAVAEDWTTRRLEQAAREAGAPRVRPTRKAPRVTADQQALAERLADVVSLASGTDVHVQPGAGDEYTFTIRGRKQAQALVQRLAEGDPPAG